MAVIMTESIKVVQTEGAKAHFWSLITPQQLSHFC